MPDDEKDWADVPAKKAVASSDEWGDVKPKGRPANQAGAMQMEPKGPIVNASEADIIKRGAAGQKQRNAEAGMEVGEHAAAGAFPGGEIALGAAKGAMSTGRNLGGLGIKALKYLKPDLGAKAEAAWPEATEGAGEPMKPHGIQQDVGFGGEQAAEFALPGGAVTKGAKAAEAGIDATRLAPLAKSALKLLSRGGLEAASAGGVTAAQGGPVLSNSLIAGALPAASAALKPVATALSEKAAPALANKVLRPVPTQLENAARFGRNPGQALADEKIIATSHGDLVTRIADRKQDVGQQIGTMLKTSQAKPVNVAMHIQKPINDAIQDAADGKIEGGEPLIAKLQELRNQFMAKRVLQPDGTLKIMGPKGLTLSPAEMHTLKRQIGDSTKWSEDTLTQTVNDVKRNIYGNLNKEIQNQVPGVGKLQDRYGNLLEAERAAEREFARHEARNSFSLTDRLAALGGLGAGALHGDFGHMAVGAAAAGAGSKVIQSPLFQTMAVQAVKNAPKTLNPEFLKFVRNAAFGARSDNRQ